MQLEQLNLNRNLFKSEPDPVYSGSAEVSASNNNGTPQNSVLGDKSGEKEANQIVTGTVITDCIIKTSPGSNRIELAGNNLDFYNDTYMEGGVVKGDTASMNFVRSDDATKFFRMENRVSFTNDANNVLSLYASPPFDGYYNSLFIGRDGDLSKKTDNIGHITMSVVHVNGSTDVKNGIFQLEYKVKSDSIGDLMLIAGDTDYIFGTGSGFSTLLNSNNGGYSGIGYNKDMGIYMHSVNEIFVTKKLIPEKNNSCDIGSLSNEFKNIYFAGDIYAGATKGVDAAFNVKDVNGVNTHSLIFSKGILVYHAVS